MTGATSTYRPAPNRKFDVGDSVTVQIGYPAGHCRVPYYIRGKSGEIERICGAFPDPETRAYGEDGLPERILYRVRFSQTHVWPTYAGPQYDTIELEIYEHWLNQAEERAEGSEKSNGK